MQREILFRAQRVDNRKLVEGDLIHGVGYEKGNMFILPIKQNLAHLEGCHALNGYQVVPETIGQFTGITDKNGIKIFEWDIVNIKSGEEYMYIREIDKNCVVKFSYGSFNPVDIDEVHYDFGNIDEFEVIGNTYDNPELVNK